MNDPDRRNNPGNIKESRYPLLSGKLILYTGIIHVFDGLTSICIGTYLVVIFGFGSYGLNGRSTCIWIGGYMLLIGVSNAVAIKIALKRSLVIISLIANVLGLGIASLGGVIHIKLLCSYLSSERKFVISMFLMQIIMVVLMLVEFTLCASLTYHIFTATRCKNTRGSGIRHQWLEHDFHSTAPPSNENNIECHQCAEINIAYNYRDEQPPPYSEIHRTGPLLNETDIGCDPCVETNITDNYRDLSPPPYRL